MWQHQQPRDTNPSRHARETNAPLPVCTKSSVFAGAPAQRPAACSCDYGSPHASREQLHRTGAPSVLLTTRQLQEGPYCPSPSRCEPRKLCPALLTLHPHTLCNPQATLTAAAAVAPPAPTEQPEALASSAVLAWATWEAGASAGQHRRCFACVLCLSTPQGQGSTHQAHSASQTLPQQRSTALSNPDACRHSSEQPYHQAHQIMHTSRPTQPQSDLYTALVGAELSAISLPTLHA